MTYGAVASGGCHHGSECRDDEVSNLVDKTVAHFGRLDVAVSNAGTEGQVGPITDQTAESYAATFGTNVLGVILSMKHDVRVMRGQGNRSIVNISSTYGHEGPAGASERHTRLIVRLRPRRKAKPQPRGFFILDRLRWLLKEALIG